MSLPFFICGVARVAMPAAFTATAFADPQTGIVLAGPFGGIVFLVAVYDARVRRRRRAEG